MKKLLAIILILILSFGGCTFKEKPLKIVTVTDLHFTGKEAFSYEGSFAAANDNNGTGKQVRYVEEIFDAFIYQMLSEKPDFIVITGDLAFDGAKASHLALKEKLLSLSEAGSMGTTGRFFMGSFTPRQNTVLPESWVLWQPAPITVARMVSRPRV